MHLDVSRSGSAPAGPTVTSPAWPFPPRSPSDSGRYDKPSIRFCWLSRGNQRYAASAKRLSQRKSQTSAFVHRSGPTASLTPSLNGMYQAMVDSDFLSYGYKSMVTTGEWNSGERFDPSLSLCRMALPMIFKARLGGKQWEHQVPYPRETDSTLP